VDRQRWKVSNVPLVRLKSRRTEYDVLGTYSVGTMEADRDWNAYVEGMLKAGLKRRHLSYKDLADKLRDDRREDSQRNITNRANRGTLTAAFFVQCLEAIGCHMLHLKESE
jgi:hypothetical protein